MTSTGKLTLNRGGDTGERPCPGQGTEHGEMWDQHIGRAGMLTLRVWWSYAVRACLVTMLCCMLCAVMYAVCCVRCCMLSCMLCCMLWVACCVVCCDVCCGLRAVLYAVMYAVCCVLNCVLNCVTILTDCCMIRVWCSATPSHPYATSTCKRPERDSLMFSQVDRPL